MSYARSVTFAGLLLFAALAAPAAAHAAPPSFRVTEAALTSDPTRWSGPCPVKVIFKGVIRTDGPGTVKYTFTRSDGATGPVHRLDFAAAGEQIVETDWTLGDARLLPHYEGWQAIKILSPNELESGPAKFVVECGVGGKGVAAGGATPTIILPPGGAPSSATPAYPQSLPEPGTDRPRDNASVAATTVQPGAHERAAPLTHQTGIGPGDPLGPDGNPRTGGGSTGGVRPLEGSFRVTLNGYRVNRETRDHALEVDGVGDEVTLVFSVARINSEGRFHPLRWGNLFSSLMGQRPPNEVRAGSRHERGGLRTGDSFPTTTPWRRLTPLNPGIPPNVLFEGPLVQNQDAALVIPTIWESDGAWSLHAAYSAALERDRPNITRAVVGAIRGASVADPRALVTPGAALGIGETVTLGHGPLGLGEVNNRPVGMTASSDRFGFTPQALVLTYDSARLLARADFGFGRGVIPVRYADDPRLEGDYTLFVQVEEAGAGGGAGGECPAALGSTFTGTATMTTSHESARGPFVQRLTLPVEFTECRGSVRITSFTPVSVSFDTPVGRNTTTVSLAGGGTGAFASAGGRMDIPVRLRFEHSIGAARPSEVEMTLSTAGAGGSAHSSGRITLAGTGRFAGGFLDGQSCTLVVDGAFSPAP